MLYLNPMHPIQQKLQALIMKKDISQMSLREIGRLIDEKDSPQTIKHHLAQLQRKGYVNLDNTAKIYSSIQASVQSKVSFTKIPIFGDANCGVATRIALEEIKGYLQIASSVLKRNSKSIFALQARGDSMNMAKIDGNAIEDGNYVLVDAQSRNYKDNDYILSIIEGCANIKKLKIDKKNNQLLLISESKNIANYPPIVISETDSYLINGKVIQVIKSV